MAEHDPLCPQPAYDQTPCKPCDLIARARADERVQVGRVWAKREDLLMADVIAVRKSLTDIQSRVGKMEFEFSDSGDALAGLRAIADRWESDPDRYDIEIAAVRDALALFNDEEK